MMMANVSKIEKFSNFEAMKFERTRGKSASTRTRTTLHSEAGRRKRGPNPSLMLSTQEDTSSPVGVGTQEETREAVAVSIHTSITHIQV